jgi:hypothetical protein
MVLLPLYAAVRPNNDEGLKDLQGRQHESLLFCTAQYYNRDLRHASSHPRSSAPYFTMASLNTSTNGPSIKSSYQGVVNSPAPSGPAAKSETYGQWALFSVSAPLVNAFQQDSGGKESVLKVQSTGGKSRLLPVYNV